MFQRKIINKAFFIEKHGIGSFYENKKAKLMIVMMAIAVILMITMQYIDVPIKNKGGQSIIL